MRRNKMPLLSMIPELGQIAGPDLRGRCPRVKDRQRSSVVAAVSVATLPELQIAPAVIAAFGVFWLSYIAEQKGRHTLPVVLTWAACLLAAISAIWWTS